MKLNAPISLKSQIKKEIGRRVIVSSLIIIIAIITLTFYDMSNSLQRLQTAVTRNLKSMEDFTISEMFLNNPQAINVKLKDSNIANKKYDIKWIPYKQAKFKNLKWIPPFQWSYNYQLANIAGYSFGYFQVTGSLFDNISFVYDLILRLVLMFVFLVVLILFLYPLTSKIPKKLFIEPISHFLEMLASDEKHHKRNAKLPIELATMENKIKDLMEKTKEQERNQAALDIAEMTRHVAHDLRNYLSGLHETINLSNNLSDEERKELTGYVVDIYNMSENLLEKYRTTKNSLGKRENVIVLNQIKKSLMLASKQKSTQHKIFTKFENTIYSCFSVIEPQKFQRILNNLITNAIQADSSKIEVYASCTNSHALIKIRDNGIGIPKDILNKIGHSEVTYGKQNGNGIGLYQAYKSIQSWNGAIEIESELEQGTTITITLPCSTSRPSWFKPEINLHNVENIIVLDDETRIHKKWRKRFENNKKMKILFFQSAMEFEKFMLKPEPKSNSLYLIDLQLSSNQSINGLTLIKKHNLEECSVLVTNKAEDPSLRNECENQNVKLLDKINIESIPINIEIDDNTG